MQSLSSFLNLFGARPHHHHSVLFLLRKPQKGSALYSPYHQPSSGLLNSATFVRDMLERHGIIARLVEVVDSNDIDREVVKHNPGVVILEAIWCPPAKLVELTKLHRHKGRHWIVRNHSELPFLAMEGGALDWLLTYPEIPHVSIACNSPVAAQEVEQLTGRAVILLPNYYPVSAACHRDHLGSSRDPRRNVLDVGCFGAIRPLKNHLEQAAAAILFARMKGRHLRFHINASRIEGKGEPILKALRALFAHVADAQLVEHEWMSHHAFTRLCRTMDLGLQASFSETFNIVAADLVDQGVPVVGSAQIPWLPVAFHADPTSALDIVDKMGYAIDHGSQRARRGLVEYSRESEKTWVRWLRRD